jgi:hypothetical protein
MSHSKHRLTPAAAALIAACAQSAVAAAAPTKEYFQEQELLSCNAGTCVALFTDLANNQVLDVERIRCRIGVTGNPWKATAGYVPNNPLFSVPLILVSQQVVAGNESHRLYTFDSDMGFRVPFGRQPRVEIKYAGGTSSSACIVTGVRLTFP